MQTISNIPAHKRTHNIDKSMLHCVVERFAQTAAQCCNQVLVELVLLVNVHNVRTRIVGQAPRQTSQRIDAVRGRRARRLLARRARRRRSAIDRVSAVRPHPQKSIRAYRTHSLSPSLQMATVEAKRASPLAARSRERATTGATTTTTAAAAVVVAVAAHCR